MLASEPGIQEAVYQALAVVEALIQTLIEKDVLDEADRRKLLKEASDRLSQSDGEIQKGAGKKMRDLLTRTPSHRAKLSR